MLHVTTMGKEDWRPTAASDQMATTILRKRRVPRRHFPPPKVLSNEVVLALLADCPEPHTSVRNWTLLALLFRGGLRLGEALNLRLKDLGLAAYIVRVLHAKDGHSGPAGSTLGRRRRSPAG